MNDFVVNTSSNGKAAAASVDDGWESQLQLFYGRATAMQATVYALLPFGGDVTITGSISGPECIYARTLPATFQFVPHPDGPALAVARLNEICFWTPRAPFLYRVDLELRRHGKLLGRVRRILGIRPLGARGRDLLLEHKRWVLRGVKATELPEVPLSDWHEAATAMVVRNPADALCAEASHVGVLIVAEVPDDAELSRLARWPAVGVVIFDPDSGPASIFTSDAPHEIHRVGDNLLLAQRGPPQAFTSPARWAQVAVCDAAEPEAIREFVARNDIPVIALREAGPQPTLEAARKLCDRLQADLAPAVDLAGYIV